MNYLFLSSSIFCCKCWFVCLFVQLSCKCSCTIVQYLSPGWTTSRIEKNPLPLPFQSADVQSGTPFIAPNWISFSDRYPSLSGEVSMVFKLVLSPQKIYYDKRFRIDCYISRNFTSGNSNEALTRLFHFHELNWWILYPLN